MVAQHEIQAKKKREPSRIKTRLEPAFALLQAKTQAYISLTAKFSRQKNLAELPSQTILHELFDDESH